MKKIKEIKDLERFFMDLIKKGSGKPEKFELGGKNKKTNGMVFEVRIIS